MDIKTYIAAAVVALTAACAEKAPEQPAVEATADATDTVQLNDDGSVKEAAPKGDEQPK